MDEYYYTVHITLCAPVLSQASGARVYGVDTASLRDAKDVPALPGSLIRGNLRHAWQAFNKHASGSADIPQPGEIEDWLGVASKSGTNDEPCRARLEFAQYWAPEEKGNRAVRYRIERAQDTGAVVHGALQVIEAPHGTGEQMVYKGWSGPGSQMQRRLSD
jgi:hypothetical protein